MRALLIAYLLAFAFLPVSYGDGEDILPAPTPIDDVAPEKSSLIQGTASGGGGDPLATEFINLARRAQIAFLVSPLGPQFKSGLQLSRKIYNLESSLDGHSPQIEFHPGSTVDCFGEPKMACVGADGIIRVARESWQAASVDAKIELVSMELFAALGVSDRYVYAPRIRQYLMNRRQSLAEELSTLFEGTLRETRLTMPDLKGSAWACDGFTQSTDQIDEVRLLLNALQFEASPENPDRLISTGTLLNGLPDPEKPDLPRHAFMKAEDGRSYSSIDGSVVMNLSSNGALVVRVAKPPRARAVPNGGDAPCDQCSNQVRSSLTELTNQMRSLSSSEYDYYVCYGTEGPASRTAK